MSYAVIIIDLVKGNLQQTPGSQMVKEVRRILPNVQRLIQSARGKQIPVIFACDSFLAEDFIFGGRMKPHAIRGTEGAELIDEIPMTPDDYFVPKRRFSAFFKTDLDITLRSLKVDTLAIGGISTTGCVLTTAWDALSNDFKAVIVEDCCAARSIEVHEAIVNIYRESALYPLFRVLSLNEVLLEL